MHYDLYKDIDPGLTATTLPKPQRSKESRERSSRGITIGKARNSGEREIDIAIRILCKELGTPNLSQRQAHAILVKRYLDGRDK